MLERLQPRMVVVRAPYLIKLHRRSFAAEAGSYFERVRSESGAVGNCLGFEGFSQTNCISRISWLECVGVMGRRITKDVLCWSGFSREWRWCEPLISSNSIGGHSRLKPAPTLIQCVPGYGAVGNCLGFEGI